MKTTEKQIHEAANNGINEGINPLVEMIPVRKILFVFICLFLLLGNCKLKVNRHQFKFNGIVWVGLDY